jgi:hypothetical protein
MLFVPDDASSYSAFPFWNKLVQSVFIFFYFFALERVRMENNITLCIFKVISDI